MADFLVNAEDCGITTTNTVDAEMQALACYVAMGTVHSRQNGRPTINNVRPDDWPHSARLAPVSGTLDDGSTSQVTIISSMTIQPPLRTYHTLEHSDSFAEPDFSGLEQAYIDEHLSSDVDTAMGAPEGLTTTPGKPEDDLVSTALANIEGLQELPHFESDNPSRTVTGLINFSLLGGPEAPTADITN
jgi:hypothetical protein